MIERHRLSSVGGRAFQKYGPSREPPASLNFLQHKWRLCCTKLGTLLRVDQELKNRAASSEVQGCHFHRLWWIREECASNSWSFQWAGTSSSQSGRGVRSSGRGTCEGERFSGPDWVFVSFIG